jgi:hypothetical protein
MIIVGLRAPTTLLFYMALRERGPTTIDDRRPGVGFRDRGLLSLIRNQSP